MIQLAREGRLDFFVSRIQIHIFVQKTWVIIYNFTLKKITYK